jgi:hypothetical protein
MAGPEFFQTMMGKRFFESTAPRIATALEEIAEALTKKPEPERAESGMPVVDPETNTIEKPESWGSKSGILREIAEKKGITVVELVLSETDTSSEVGKAMVDIVKEYYKL